MITKRKAGLVLMVIFTMIVNFTVNAFDQDMTRHIESTDQDRYVLETGSGVDSTFMTVLSPHMDIRGMLFFEDIKINGWEKLTNATLRLRTVFGRPFDAESTITIYGVRDYGQFGYSEKGIGAPGSPSAILSLPITMAHVDYNTSQFYGPQWWEIDVTNIVNEMKNDPHYDGPGSDASKLGDNMIFTIFGAGGHDRRFFYDFKAGNGLEAQLVLHWTDSPHPPPSLPGTADYLNTSGGWDIWRVMEWLNFTTFTVAGGHSALISGLNDTYFHVQQMEGDKQVWMQRAFPDRGEGIVNRKFGIEFTALNAGGGGSAWIGHWGISDTSNTWINDWNNGYAFVARVFDTPDEAHRGTAWDIEANALGDSNNWFYSINHIESNMPYTLWFKIELNMNLAYYNVSTYNDFEMTDLNGTINYAFTDLPPTYSPGAFPYETLVNGWDNLATVMGYTANYLSSDQADFYIVDPTTNETIPVPDIDGDGDIDEDDARTLIGDVDPQPGDPAPGQSWGGTEDTVFSRFRVRLYMLLIGVGLVFGPLLVFASSRPSGYEFTIGMFVVLIGFALMYAAGQV